MVKKILFFGVAIILGFMIMMIGYSGFQMSDVQAKITEFMSHDEYNNAAKSFLPYFDEDSITTVEGDHFDLVSIQAITAENKTIKLNGEDQNVNMYNAGYTFFLNHINDIELDGEKIGDKTYNYTRIVFKNGDKSYSFNFNEPYDATSPDGEGVTRHYTGYIDDENDMNFLEIDLDLAIIEEELGGQITGYEFYDSKANPNDSTKTPLQKADFTEPLVIDTEFFTLGEELVTAWEAYVDGLTEDNLSERAEIFNNFYDPAEGEGWIDRYESHEGFAKGIQSYTDLIGNSPIVKTAVVMVVYLAICIVLGYFVLKNKNKTPKPYMRDQYKKQLVVAKANEVPAKQIETTTVNEDVNKTNEEELKTEINEMESQAEDVAPSKENSISNELNSSDSNENLETKN